MAPILSWFVLAATAVIASTIDLRASSSDPLASCPGYKASNVKTTSSSLTADLSLAGKACNVYGTDLTDLTLSVVYETGEYPPIALKHEPFTYVLQMIVFTLRSKIRPTAYIKSQHPFSHALLPALAFPPRMQIFSSTTQRLHSPSQLQEQAQERSSSILQQQASYLSLNTFDYAPISLTIRIVC
jgi:hypothetical protein